MASAPESTEIEPLVVSPKKATVLLDVGITRLYQLIGAREVESFRDGKARKIIYASLKAYIARQLKAEPAKGPARWTDRATSTRMAKTLAKAKEK